MNNGFLTTSLAVLMLATASSASVAAGEVDDPYASGRLIVIYKDGASAARKHALAVSGGAIVRVHESATGAHVLSLGPGVGAREARLLADWLRASPDVASVVPDVIVRPKANPVVASILAGPAYGDGGAYASAISLTASRRLFGNFGLTPAPVAVVDTGITPHTLLQNGLPGYSFYTLLNTTRSVDYSDHGDGVTVAEAATPAFQAIHCAAKDSSWHGTAMAGIVGAQYSAGYHIEGVAPGVSLLPAKALGKCGGYLTDIMDAALWSAGMPVPGVPGNLHPVRVINLSLSAATPRDSSSCTPYQSAIDQLRAKGVIVIAAGGNDSEDSTEVVPANCKGVLTIAASDRSGNLASYSGRGSNVALAAPGGEKQLGIVTTSNSGTLTPVAETSAAYFGTSLSTALVSGVVSLMIAANPSLQPDNVGKILKATATPIATCLANCGGGLLDADAAVRVAFEGVNYASPAFSDTDLGAHADAVVPVKNVSGLSVTFGGAVFGGNNPADFTKVADTCSGATLNGGDTCAVTVRFTPIAVGDRNATLHISSNMPSASIDVPLAATSQSAAASPPVTGTTGSAASGGGGGGGCVLAGAPGQPDPVMPLTLAMALVWLAWRRRVF